MQGHLPVLLANCLVYDVHLAIRDAPMWRKQHMATFVESSMLVSSEQQFQVHQCIDQCISAHGTFLLTQQCLAM